MITENLSTLKIHKFKSQKQYDNAKAAGKLNDNEIYLTPYEDCHLVSGEGENSIVHQGTDAQAISENAIAEQGCFAGIRGYRYTGASNFSDINLLTIVTEEPVEYQKNDVISIINGAKFINYGTLTALSTDRKTLTVSYNGDFFNNTFANSVKGGDGFDDSTIFCIAKPDVGNIDLGMNSRASGINTKALSYGANANGRDTTVESQYGTTFGRQTKARYAAMAINRNTQALGDNSFAGGSGTIVYSGGGFGHGQELRVTGVYQSVRGRFNAYDDTNNVTRSEYIDVVGNGTSDTNRSNAYTLDGQGNGVFAGKVTAGAGPVNPLDLTTKQWVEDYAYSKEATDNQITTTKNWVTSNFLSNTNNKVLISTSGWGGSIALKGATVSQNYSVGIGPGVSLNTYASLAIGHNNKAILDPEVYKGSADNFSGCVVLGNSSTVSAPQGVAIGSGLKTASYQGEQLTSAAQTVMGKFNAVLDGPSNLSSKNGALFIIGNGTHDTQRSNAFVVYGDGRAQVGTYCNPQTDASFVVGNGTSASKPSNAFAVWNDGRASIMKDPTADMDVVPKHMYDELKERLDAYDSLESDEWVEIANIYANSTTGSGFSTGTANFPSNVFSTKLRKFKLVRHNYDATTGEYKETNSANYFTGILNRSEVVIYGSLEHVNSCSPIYISIEYNNGPYAVNICNLDGTTAKPYNSSGRYKYVLHVSK